MKERIKHVNHVFLATILVSIFSGMLLGGYFRSNLSMMLYSQIMLVMPTVIYIVVKKVNIKEAIRFKSLSIPNILWLILFSYLLSPLLGVINYFSLLFSKPEINNIVYDIVANHSIIISVLVIAVIPSIFEEAVYRGIFYNEYRKVNVRKGIIISALLFALLHLNFNQFSYAFVMGVIFALVIEATDSILATMVIHLVTNGSSVLSVANQDLSDITKLTEELVFTKVEIIEAIRLLIVPTIIGTILAILVFCKIAKNCNRLDYIKSIFRKAENNEPKLEIQEENIEESNWEDILNVQRKSKVRIVTPSLLVGMGACIFIIVVGMIWG